MRFRFHYDDNESGDESPGVNCDPAQPVAGSNSRLPCPPPYFATITNTGSLAPHATQRFSFVPPVPGFPVSFNCQTNNFIQLRLYAPDGVTVIGSDINDELGVDTTAFTANQIQHTFPDGQTYFVDVTAGNNNANFILDISPGSFGYIFSTNAGTYSAIYVPQTQRIFILTGTGLGGGLNPFATNMVCINSVTMALITTVQLSPSALTTFIRASNIIFYNTHDNSVWCFERDGATGNTTFLDRFNPTTGALIEHTAWATTNMEQFGVYSPQDNLVYGCSDTTPGSTMQVFDCATRLFRASIPLPAAFNGDNLANYVFDSVSGNTYAVIPNPANVFRTLWKMSNGVLLSSQAMTNDLDIRGSHFLIHNNLIYGSDGNKTFKVLDPTTGIVTIFAGMTPTPNVGGQYVINSLAYDACRNCLAMAANGPAFVTGIGQASLAFGARFTNAGVIIEAALAQLSTTLLFSWNNCLWNPDIGRIVIITDNGIFWC